MDITRTMKHQMESNVENEMDTGLTPGFLCVWILKSATFSAKL